MRDELFSGKFPCVISLSQFPMYIYHFYISFVLWLFLHFLLFWTLFLKDLLEPMKHIYLGALSFFCSYHCILTMDKCPICLKKLQNHSWKIPCKSCGLTYHLKCIALSTEHAEYIKVNIDTWFCENCNSSLFPFNHVENEIDFRSYVADMLRCSKMSLSYLFDKLFLPFELNDRDHSIFGDTDPGLNFYNAMNQYVAQCNYYLEPYFNEHIIIKVPATK